QREQSLHHRRIEFQPNPFEQMFARPFFRTCRPEGSRISQRNIRVGDSQDARSERNLFEAEPVRVALAVPPFMMPTNKQLRATICAGIGSFAFSEDRMPREIDSLFFSQRAVALNVLASHSCLAEIVGQRRNAQREPITWAEIESLSELVSN